MDDIAVVIGKYLHFDMAGIDQEFLHVKITVAECVFSFSFGRMKSLDDLFIITADTHTASAAAGDSLDDDGEFQFIRHSERLFFIGDKSIAAGGDRDSGGFHGIAGDRFIAESFHRFGSGTDKGDTVTAAGFSEIGIFRKETVSGMDRIDFTEIGDSKQTFDKQIAFGRRRRSDANRLIGEFYSQTFSIGSGINDHGTDIQFPARPDDPDGDLTAIGDHKFVEHIFSG